MFKKKKKKREEQFIEDEIVVSMNDISKTIQSKEVIDEDDDFETEEEWAIDPSALEENYNDDLEEDIDSEDEVPLEEETAESSKRDTSEEKFVDEKAKKELGEYFEEDKKKNKNLKVKKSKTKKKSKRQLKREQEFVDINDRRIFRYKNKNYNKVEDFVKYLDNHYLDLDNIAQEIMNDENFFGWVSKKSDIFDESLKKFKEIKEKIEK